MECKGYNAFLFVLDIFLAKEKEGERGSVKEDKKARGLMTGRLQLTQTHV